MSLRGDERMARRAADGDRRAFAAIFRRYQEDLYRFCLAIVGNSQDAQDALQNTMVQALRALPGENREVRLKPWLYRVARNEAVNVIRRRPETPQLDPDLATSGEEVSTSVESRDRLRGLLADLGELPERQRAALVMRELAGLDFAEIGAAFETSAAVARQTVYEARLGLRQMESGREMTCAEAKREISNADGRALRRRDLRAHLRGCVDCRAFRDAIAGRRSDLAALAPLPAVVSAGLLQAALGGSAGTGGGALAGASAGAGAGTAGSVAGKALATSALGKSLAAVALVTAGVATADRTGLIDTPIPGGHRASSSSSPTAGESGQASSPSTGSAGNPSPAGAQGGMRKASGGSAAGGNPGEPAKGGGTEGSSGAAGPTGHRGGASGELSSSSAHGQATAGSHGGGRSNAHSHSHPNSHGGAQANGKGHSKPQHPAHPSQGGRVEHPAKGGSAPASHPPHPATGQGPPAEQAPDKEPTTPLQPPKSNSNQGGAGNGERPTS